VPFSAAEALGAAGDHLPFAVAGVKFTPEVGEAVSFIPGQELMVTYQIWAATAIARGAGKLQVEYAYGRLGFPGDVKRIAEELDRSQFDASGSMLTGKKIPTVELQPGNYRLTVTVSDPATQQKAATGASFRIVSTAEGRRRGWDVYDDKIAQDYMNGTVSYQRALAYLAQGDKDHALHFLEDANRLNPANELARTRLTDLYFERKDFAGVARLFHSGISAQTEERSILQAAESFSRTGDNARSIELLESALKLKPPTEPLYLSLATYYETAGNAQKATELRSRSHALQVEIR
jgi:tetratricopeptide (TPR) repeat protein